MNIAEYSSYFHDGSVIDIVQNENEITISMESAEVSADELKEPLLLSANSTIKGKLHLKGIKNINVGNQRFLGRLKMLYDSGGILHFKLIDNIVKLDLDWVNYPPHPDVTAYSFYEIEAEKIWWENIPDLKDPFW